MIDLGKTRGLVRTGATVMLTLSMTMGSLPVGAIAAYAQEGTAVARAAAVNKDGYALETGKEYTVSVALKKENGSASMAASYFEKTATLTWSGSSYTLRFSVTEDGRSYITGIEGATALGDGAYEASIASLDPVKLDFALQIPVIGTMNQSAYLHIDASALPIAPAVDVTALESAISAAQAVAQGSKTDEAYATLQQAITAAQSALTAAASQVEVDAAVTALAAAVDAFNASADKAPETPEATELGFSLYYKGEEATSKYGKNFEDKVRAVPQADGTYLVELTAKGSEMMQLGDIAVGGKAVAYTDNEDGSRTYSIPMADLTATLDFTFGYTIPSMGMTHNWPFQLVLEGGTYTGPSGGDEETKADTSKLEAAVKRAEALKEADGSADAWTALQSALASANKVLATSGVPQAGIDAVTSKLEAAITAFEASEPSSPSTPEEKPSEDAKLEVGKVYTVPAALVKADGSSSMAAGYFEKTATVVYDGTSYQVTFKVTSEGQGYIKAVKSAAGSIEDLGGGSYRATVSDLKSWIELTFSLATPAGNFDQTGYLKLDTSQLGLAEQEKPSTTPDTGDASGSGNGSASGSATETGGVATEAFQVGHTYRVPVAFKKAGSSETSMASQYFGDTALVRPQADGTYTVSFSTNKAEWISSLTYADASVSRSGGQFTLTIPASKVDQVLRLGFTIVPMGNLAVSCDMHLYLSRATDLGTGQEGLAASSDKVLPQTGDAAAMGIVASAAAGIMALVGAEALRRRRA